MNDISLVFGQGVNLGSAFEELWLQNNADEEVVKDCCTTNHTCVRLLDDQLYLSA